MDAHVNTPCLVALTERERRGRGGGQGCVLNVASTGPKRCNARALTTRFVAPTSSKTYADLVSFGFARIASRPSCFSLSIERKPHTHLIRAFAMDDTHFSLPVLLPKAACDLFTVIQDRRPLETQLR